MRRCLVHVNDRRENRKRWIVLDPLAVCGFEGGAIHLVGLLLSESLDNLLILAAIAKLYDCFAAVLAVFRVIRLDCPRLSLIGGAVVVIGGI